MKKLFTSLVVASTVATLAACGKTTTTNTKTTTTEKVKPENKTTPLTSYTGGVKQPAITKGTFKIEDELFKSLVISEEQQGDDPVRLPAEKISEPVIVAEAAEVRFLAEIEGLDNIHKELGRVMQQSEYDINEKEQAFTRLNMQFDKLAWKVEDELYKSPDTAKEKVLDEMYTNFNILKKKVRHKLHILWNAEETSESQEEQEARDEINTSSETIQLEVLDNTHKELGRLTQQPEYNLVQKKQELNNIYTQFNELAKEVQDELDESPDTAKQEALDKMYTKFYRLSKQVEGELYYGQSEAEETLEPEATPAIATADSQGLETQETSESQEEQEAEETLEQEILNESDESSETIQLEALDNIHKELGRLMQQSEYDINEKKQAFTRLNIQFDKLAWKIEDRLSKSPDTAKEKVLYDKMYRKFELFTEVQNALYHEQSEALDNIYKELGRLTQQPEYNLVQKKQELDNIHTQFGELGSELEDELYKSPDTAKKEALYNMYTKFSRLFKQVEGELYYGQSEVEETLEPEATPSITTADSQGLETQETSESQEEQEAEETLEPEATPSITTAGSQGLEIQENSESQVEQEAEDEINASSETIQLEALDNIYKELGRLMQEVESGTVIIGAELDNIYIQFNELVKEVQDELDESSDTAKQEALDKMYTKIDTLWVEVEEALYELIYDEESSVQDEPKILRTRRNLKKQAGDELNGSLETEYLEDIEALTKFYENYYTKLGWNKKNIRNKVEEMLTKINVARKIKR